MKNYIIVRYTVVRVEKFGTADYQISEIAFQGSS